MDSIAALSARLRGNCFYHRIPVVLLIIVIVFLTACTGANTNRVQFTDDRRWEAGFVLPYNPSTNTVAIDAENAPTLETLQGTVQPALDALAIQSTWTVRGDYLELSLSGEGGAAQVARLFYGALSSLTKPFDPGTEIVLTGEVQDGEALTFSLESSLTSGYAWQDAGSQGVRLLASGDFATAVSQVGAPLRQTLHYEALEGGIASVVLVYRRPWEEPPSTGRTVTIQAPRLGQLADLTYPDRAVEAAAASPEQPVDDLERISPLANQLAAQGLPSAFDWRSLGKVPPVRNQGSCGSCWAFATVGVLESAIMIQDNVKNIDLSEQFLISCNQENWGCNGGATAHDYHWWKKGADQNQAGAVFEVDFPYQDKDSTCRAVSNHPYQIDGWGYVPESDPVDVEAIKQAIYQYGPIKVAVCAGPAFQSYKSGIFATDEKQVCGGYTNHGVILVGWDDAQGPNGVWILRNSWGLYWGEAGYMRIDRRTSNVGVDASYVIYSGDGQVFSGEPRAFLPSIMK